MKLPRIGVQVLQATWVSCRGEVRQLVHDRELLRQMQSAAIQSRNHVEAFFCDCLLAAVRELLPDDVKPTGADLRATVTVRAVEPQDVPETTPEEELSAVLSQLVDALKVSLRLSSPRGGGNRPASRPHAPWQKTHRILAATRYPTRSGSQCCGSDVM